MSDYIVSARKYRPHTFDTVVGQEHITTTLKNAIRSQHLAHAFLFCGPRGVGKTSCARILAKTINCEHPTPEMEACGTCGNCQSFNTSSSFNVFELDAASNNSVEDIRELTNQVRFAPQQGKYKVYIIDEVHMLSSNAFNAFLKTLEEPPAYAIFILATTEKHKILPTILSRCQIFDFKRITTHDIVNHLLKIAVNERMAAQEAALHIIAQKSEGCMRDALSMLDRIASFTNGMLTYNNTMEHLNLLDADFYFGLVDKMLAQDVAGALLLLDQALEKGFEGEVIVTGIAEHMRNLLLCKDARMAKLLDVPNDHKATYYHKANQTPPSFIISALNVLNDCELEYKNSTNKRLHVEMCLIRLCYLLQATSGSAHAVVDEKKNSSAAPIAPPVAPPIVVAQESTTPYGSVAPTYLATAALTPPPTQHIVPPAAPKPAAPLPPPANASKRMVSMKILDEIEEQPLPEPKVIIDLTQEIANTCKDIYFAQLKAEEKTNILEKFDNSRFEVVSGNELNIITHSEYYGAYIKTDTSTLVEIIKNQIGKYVRINVNVESMNIVIDQPLTGSKLFETMVAQNPNLYTLQSKLGLTIS